MKVSECILLGQNTALQEMSLIGPLSSKLIMIYQQQTFLQLKAIRLCLLAVNLEWIQNKELMALR